MILDFREERTKILHLCWIAFFLCFFNWFSLAPLMPMIKQELHLSKTQITLIVMAAVFATIPLRVIVGWAVDKFGGRRLFTFLLVASAFPVAGMALSQSFLWLFACRIVLGLIGAGFVVGIQIIDCWFRGPEIGKAEGVYAGWGNAGSAGASLILPLVAAYFGWRWAFVFAASLLLIYAPIFYRYVRDTPFGDIPQLKLARVYQVKTVQSASLLKDRSVMIMSYIYAACFGAELTAVAYLPSYLHEIFSLPLKQAGMVAGIFGTVVLFARPSGGIMADKFGGKKVLAICLFLEGLSFIFFALQIHLSLAVFGIVATALFTHFCTGAEFAIVPSILPNHSGKVAGYVGAGGNIGGLILPIAFGAFGYKMGFITMGLCAIIAAFLVKLIVIREKDEFDNEGIWGTGRVVMMPVMDVA